MIYYITLNALQYDLDQKLIVSMLSDYLIQSILYFIDFWSFVEHKWSFHPFRLVNLKSYIQKPNFLSLQFGAWLDNNEQDKMQGFISGGGCVVSNIVSEYSVYPHPLHWFYACSCRTGWVVRYSTLCQCMSANIGLRLWAGTWSSTMWKK